MKLNFSATLSLAMCLGVSAQLSHPLSAFSQSTSKSPKRGVAFDLANASDLSALSPGVSWWYNWASTPNAGVPSNYVAAYGMDYYPMLWNSSFNVSTVESFILANPQIKYLLVLNEPNVSGQATCGGASTYCQPAAAAALWPQFEAIAQSTGVQIVGPQITWGTDPNYSNPVTWLNAFYSAYESANSGRQPRIDFLGFHWYDYGLDAQLTTLAQFDKPFWVTELANWHSQNDGAQITTLAAQETQMTSMVSDLEGRGDVFRYAWFTGRVSPDPHFSSLLAGTGVLTGLGQEYINLPYSAPAKAVLIDSGSTSTQSSYVADTNVSGGSVASTTHAISVDTTVDTASQAIYQSNRYGNFTYTVGGFSSGTMHTVRLHFAETYWNATNDRTFNVTINGSQVLTNYDILRAAGTEYKARVETFSTAPNASGQIVIQFTTVKDNAQVNGIEIE